MIFDSITNTVPSWLSSDGPESGIIISSRARLARNVSGYKYAHREDNDKLGEIVGQVLDAAPLAGFDRTNYFQSDNLDQIHRSVLLERHLLTRNMASKSGSRGVLVMENEAGSILVNEEDHLRLQAIRSGFDPMGAFAEVSDIEEKLSGAIKFSFSEDYGYLTACPTNYGTGLRASVLIHLPALVITKEIQRVIRSSGQLGLAVRGYYGEGSEIVGNLFQISNQRSLGKTEPEIIDALVSVVTSIIDYEKQAALTLMSDAKSQTEDKIWRSIGILRTARVLSTGEFMNLSSAVRLGCFLGFLDTSLAGHLNDLLVLVQPGHLQQKVGRQVDALERDRLRADSVRERFVDVSI